MTVFSRRLAWCGAAALIVTWAVAMIAQGTEPTGQGSLAAVASEVRQLRAALEESTRTQTQTQALSMHLSAQQARLLQASGRLDAARRELDRVTTLWRNESLDVKTTEEQLRNAHPDMRGQMQELMRVVQLAFTKVAAELEQAQSRELEASQSLQTEEARWDDLINRLEQLVKK